MRLSAVLPVSIRGSYDVDDLGRVELLFRSLSAFAEPNMFDQFLIVCPNHEVKIIEEKCLKWSSLNIKVVSEDVLVPEFAAYPKMRGWRKQQIIKLAAPRILDCDFFMTFDADILCLKSITKSMLLIEGKAIMQYEMRSRHPKWWKSSARILDMSADVGDIEKGMAITPAILSSEICKETTKEIENNLRGKGTWADRLCQLHNPIALNNWSLHRFKRARWTEYSLYYLCAHKLGLIDKYHIPTGTETAPTLIVDLIVTHPFSDWDPTYGFSKENRSLFCSTGSKHDISPNIVWEKIAPFIPLKIK